MISLLKNHPFPVEAFFESSTVLTFAVPKAQLAPLIPPCLQLDSFQDRWAFIAIAMVETSGLRPKGFPAFMGQGFFLIGYRIFVRYVNERGKRLRGLYILKSETNRKQMEILGNIFTHYNYTTTDIKQETWGSERSIRSKRSNFEVIIDQEVEEVPLPTGSPFADWKEARRYAGPLPFTFTYFPSKKEVLIIEGVRQSWKPQAINVHRYSFDFLDKLNLKGYLLANAFEITQVPYNWKKGKIESWQANERPSRV